MYKNRLLRTFRETMAPLLCSIVCTELAAVMSADCFEVAEYVIVRRSVIEFTQT